MKTLILKPLLIVLIFLFNFSITFSQVFVTNHIRDFNKIDAKIQSDKDLKKAAQYDKFFKVDSVMIYGSGGLLGLATTTESDENKTSTSGSLGLNFVTERISMDFYYSYNGVKELDVSTLGNFGKAMMNPNLSGQALSVSAAARLSKKWGASIDYKASNQLWKIDSNTTINSSPLILSLGMYWTPLDFSNIGTNKFNFVLGLNYVNRTIRNNFANKNILIEGEKINPTGYHGIDFTIGAYVNSLELFMRYSWNLDGDIKYDIPNYSGTQVSFGVNVSGKMLTVK